jgi:hypothetical protein
MGIPELMVIGLFGVLVAGVALGFGWMIFRPRSK